MSKHLRDIVKKLPDTTPKNYDSLYGKRKVEKVTLGQNDDYYIGSDDKGAKKFVAKHEVEVHDYPVQNDGDVPFKAGNIKYILSADKEKLHGYQGYPSSEDKKVYEEVDILEELKVSDGIKAWIKDFQDSNAPQFEGKTKEERRKMALAAFLEAKRKNKDDKKKE